MPLSSLEFMSFLKFFLLSSSFIELLLEKIYVMAAMYSNSSALLCFWLTFHTGSCCMSNASLQFEIFLPQLLSARVTGLHGHTRLWHVLCLTYDLSFLKKYIILFIYVYVYTCVSASARQRPKESIQFPGTAVRDAGEPTHGCWESNSAICRTIQCPGPSLQLLEQFFVCWYFQPLHEIVSECKWTSM